MKHALFLASLVLVAGSAVGCGGDDKGGSSAPDNTSTEDFCKSLTDVFKDFQTIDENADSSKIVEALKSGADKLGETGTPDGIPADARHGFEVFVEAIDNLDDDADVTKMDSIPGVSKDDEADIEAFFTYATTKCAGALGVPTDVPSS